MRARFGRVMLLLLSHSVAALLASCATFCHLELRPQILPTLLKNVEPSYRGRNQDAFNDWLVLRFPVGSASSDLTQELARDDFQVWAVAAPWHGAIFDNLKRPGFELCHRVATVKWQEDDAGHLTAVSGDYYVTCL